VLEGKYLEPMGDYKLQFIRIQEAVVGEPAENWEAVIKKLLGAE
jgi:hypothetical protein